jgi:hypothetical protein
MCAPTPEEISLESRSGHLEAVLLRATGTEGRVKKDW